MILSLCLCWGVWAWRTTARRYS